MHVFLISNVQQIKNFERELFAQFAKSFALRQKMLNFLQNLEYYMTFEVLEPNWVEMITKIKSGKVENVDQVLEIHNDFLSTCLNDCMLSSPELLSVVKKLLSISVEFCGFMETVTSSMDDMDQFHDQVQRFVRSPIRCCFSTADCHDVFVCFQV